MKQIKAVLGIDISKDSFDYCLIDQSENIIQEKLQMDLSGFESLNSFLESYSKDELLICFESTGIYHINLLSFLLNQKYQVTMANPLLINGFLKSSTLRKSKTDQKDAKAIAMFARTNQKAFHLATEQCLDSLKPLIRERENISKDIARIKTEIKGLLVQLFPELPKQINVFTKSILNLLYNAPSAKEIKMKSYKALEQLMLRTKGKKLAITPKEIKDLAQRSIGISNRHLEAVLISKVKKLLFYQNELDNMDKLVDSEIARQPSLDKDINILKTINGIGEVTAKNFIIEIVNIRNFETHKQLTAFIGTDPAIKQSGTSVDIKGKITKRGSAYLRRTIYQMAMGVTRVNPIFRAYFQKKRSEGKKYKQAMICVANKLIRTIFAMLKNKTDFNKNVLPSVG